MQLTVAVAFERQASLAAWRTGLLAGALMVCVPSHAAPAAEQSALTTGDIVCTARKSDRRFGYRYRYDVTLSVRAGQVRRLKLSQWATSKDGDDHGCAIGLDDLRQETGDGAIVLRDADREAKPGCTIRIIAEGGQIRIRIGDAAEEGNDCRGGDKAMYCSPRSFWTDVIIDRKSSTCRPAE